MQTHSELVSVTPETWTYVGCRSGLEADEIAASIEKAFSQLTEAIARGGVRTSGPPRAHYHYRDEKGLGFDLGFPIKSEDMNAAERAGLGVGRTLSGSALALLHQGPYASLSEAYKKLEQDSKDKGFLGRGDTWEVYLNDPDNTPATKLKTQIYWPIAERSNS